MDISDLRSFLVIARYANLQTASTELHQSPSALSKAIRRLESALNTPIFDRIGKSIHLNPQGERLRERALHLVTLSDQLQAEFRGETQHAHCRIVGPALLQWCYATKMATLLRTNNPGSGIAFASQFEDAALLSLKRGEADFALVTGVAVSNALTMGLQAISLGTITMQLAAGLSHPIVGESSISKHQTHKSKPPSFTTAQVLQYDFACPDRSLFCGLERGARSDGWRDDLLPRRIRFWLDDLQLLLSLVRAGQALAYLPDFAFSEPGLIRLQVSDCPYQCVEQAWLVWRTGSVSGWQNRLIESLSSLHGQSENRTDQVF